MVSADNWKPELSSLTDYGIVESAIHAANDKSRSEVALGEYPDTPTYAVNVAENLGNYFDPVAFAALLKDTDFEGKSGNEAIECVGLVRPILIGASWAISNYDFSKAMAFLELYKKTRTKYAPYKNSQALVGSWQQQKRQLGVDVAQLHKFTNELFDEVFQAQVKCVKEQMPFVAMASRTNIGNLDFDN